MLSLWLELVPRNSWQATTDLGTRVHGLFFATLARLDPGLSEGLHNLKRRKPFTVSTLLDGARRPTTCLTAGQSHYIRLTAFEPALAHVLARHFLLETPAPMRLGESDINLVAVSLDNGAPGGGWNTYSQLLSLPAPARLTLAFDSATTLRQKGHNLPLPDPAGLFNGYLSKWNAFSPLPLSPDVVNSAVDAGALLLTWHDIRSAVVRLRGTPQIGFTGLAQFRLKPGAFTTALAALARFAPYCGSGYHSTQGMGRTWYDTAADGAEEGGKLTDAQVPVRNASRAGKRRIRLAGGAHRYGQDPGRGHSIHPPLAGEPE